MSEGKKCLDDHRFWEDKEKVNKGRRYVCGTKLNQNGSHISKYSERPGGLSEHTDIPQRVQSWIMCELPKSPNGEDPRRVPPSERGRQRSKSRSNQKDQPQQPTQQFEGPSVWDYGKELEKLPKHVLKVLHAARKELTDQGRVTEELKEALKGFQERIEPSPELDQLKELVETIPFVERMNEQYPERDF